MNCLLVADIHYSLKQFDWIGQASAKFDMVIIAGDLLDISSVVAKEAQIVVVLKYLRRMLPHTKLVVSSGNHDGDTITASSEHVANWLAQARGFGARVDGDSWMEGDNLFTICQWRSGQATGDQILRQLESDALKERQRWIWVYHEPPQDCSVSWTGKSFQGDSQLGPWIERFQPDMVLSGHVHQAPFRNHGSWVFQIGSTWVFNMGRQIGPVPSFITIDFKAYQAMWISQAGRELLNLNHPFDPQAIVTLA